MSQAPAKAKKPMKLKILLECEVDADGTMGGLSCVTTAPHRSGYSIADPYKYFNLAGKLFDKAFETGKGIAK